MGVYLANVASHLGFEVTLIIGPNKLPLSLTNADNIKKIDVVSAKQMYEETLKYYMEQDILIFSAAVADYTPKNQFLGKLKKETHLITNIELVETVDILKTITSLKLAHQKIIGFALESQDLESNAESKLIRKNADMIVANLANHKDSGFGGDNNTIKIFKKEVFNQAVEYHNGNQKVSITQKNYPVLSKKECAFVILSEIMHLYYR